MISYFIQDWCKLLTWGAVEFIAESSKPIKEDCPREPCRHPEHAALCRDCGQPLPEAEYLPQKKPTNSTGELVLGGRYQFG